MKAFLAVAFLLVRLVIVSAQSVTQLADIPLYQGNPGSLTITIPAGDSSLTTTAIQYTTKGGRELMSSLQPSVNREGRRAVLSWSAAQTKGLDAVSWLQIGAGSVVRYQAWVNTSKTPSRVTAPGALTVVSPVVVISASPPGSISDTYLLSNVGPSGYIIMHNKGNRLVRATFFREDTGQPDPLWSIRIRDENRDEVTGPPGETFSGRVALEFISQPISNQ